VIILGGKEHEVPGVTTLSWRDDPKRVPRITKVTPRTRRLRSIILHTTKGKRCPIVLAGASARSSAFAEARYQMRPVKRLPSGKVIGAASFDCVIGQDGVALWQNDPVTAFSWHAMQVNAVSLGIELCQDLDGTMYRATLDSACRLVAFLCEQLGIQKQLPWEPAADRPYAGRIERLDPGFNGSSCIGVFGHRNVWIHPNENASTLVAARGFGDPGDDVFRQLASEYRFERHAFHGKDPQDLRVWRGRQKAIGFEGIDVDGIPGPKTTARLKELSYPRGIWMDKIVHAVT
jgi:hypothetical protein